MSIKIKGRFKLEIRGTDGKIREKTEWINNATMNAAPGVVAGLVGNTGSQAAFTFLALGSSNTAVDPTQTTLVAEITTNNLGRGSATTSRVTTTQPGDTLQILKVFTATGSATIEEVGYFNASSAGVMGGRALTTTKTIVNGESITITYQIKFA